jgi:peroxiredoxin
VSARALALLASALLLCSASPALAAVDRHKSDTQYPDLTKAPDFALPAANGEDTFGLSDFRGRVRLVVFWTTWSAPSRAFVAEIKALREKYQAKGVEVLLVSTEDPEILKGYAAQTGLRCPVLVGEKDLEEEFGGVEGYPTTFVIGRHGYMYKYFVGQWPKKYVEKAIQDLL